jgi:hypothetical protein
MVKSFRNSRKRLATIKKAPPFDTSGGAIAGMIQDENIGLSA